MKNKLFSFIASGMAGVLLLASCGTLTEMERIEKLRLAVQGERAELSATQLMERMREANDPDSVFLNSKSYIMRQNLSNETEKDGKRVTQEYSAEIKFRADGSLKQTSFHFNNPIKVLIRRGDDAYVLDPSRKTGSKISTREGELFNFFTAMMNPKNKYTDIFPKVELDVVYEGKERLFRLVCYTGIERVAPYVFYIDAATFLTKRLETIMVTDDGREYLYIAESQDYQVRNKVKMPMTSIVQVVGKSTDVIQTTEFILNPEIKDSEFEVPPDYKIK